MKNKQFFLLLFTLVAIAGVQCKKESELDKLPPATTTGAQTLGCLINGDAFILSPKKPTAYYATYNNGKIEIQADNQSPLGGSCYINPRCNYKAWLLYPTLR
jgi:hypothetical protein